MDRIAASYHFLCEKQKTGQSFTLDEIAAACTWDRSTPKTYLTKKWARIVKKQGTDYVVEGFNYSLDQYKRMMSQKDELSMDPRKPELKPTVESLVVKARESAVLALDVYNRPAALFRTQGFVVLMVIAWTSLLHAIMESRGQAYTYGVKTAEGEDKTWELTKCAEVLYPQNSPVRKNLEFMMGLRNRIEHHYVPSIDPHVAGECQAMLLNFDSLLTKEFTDYYAIRECLTVPLQTASIRSVSQMGALRGFQANEYDKIRDFIDTYRASLSSEVYTDPRFSFRVYLVPKVGNHESTSDLALEFVRFDPDSAEDREYVEKLNVVLVKEKRVPVVNPGMFKPSTVARIVSERIKKPFTVYNHTQAWRVYGVRQPGEDPRGCDVKYCHFDEVHRDYVYTQAWVDRLAESLSEEGEYRRVTTFRSD